MPSRAKQGKRTAFHGAAATSVYSKDAFGSLFLYYREFFHSKRELSRFEEEACLLVFLMIGRPL